MGAAAVVTVTGSGFVPATVIDVNGAARTTTYISSTQASAALPATDFAAAGTLSITAVNAMPGGGTSSASILMVNNPAPAITSILPNAGLAGASATVVTVIGSGFIPATVMDVNGLARTTTYVSSTQVSAALPATDFVAAGNLSITAVNAAPGGGVSAAATLALNNPVVGTISLTPSNLNVGAISAATIAVTGTGFVAASVIQVNGTARPTTYVDSGTLTFTATVADQATAATLAVTVVNAAPGGGTSAVANLTVTVPPPTPVITSISPTNIVRGSSTTSVDIFGTGFTSTSVAQWNGTNVQTRDVISGGSIPELIATIPASDLTTSGTASITVNTPNASPSSVSNGVTFTITDPPAPTLTGMNPAGGAINTASAVTLTGTTFNPTTTVAINGVTIPSTYVSATRITVNFPAYLLATPGNQSITVTTPAPGGGTTAALTYTTYISIANNDIVYNATDGLLYVSVPASTAGAIGNVVVGIDPNTGSIVRTIQAGTNPNKLALSTDGTQLFVGIDGAGAVAQIDLTQGKIVNQFSLGDGPGVYNPPNTAAYLAAIPGLPNSVAVALAGYISSSVTIYDSGVARAGSSTVGSGPLSFGSSASTLYLLASSALDALTVGSTGITNSSQIGSSTYGGNGIQYDNGALYLSTGQVVDASTGALKGTFYSTGTTPANGPTVSDSTLGRAFVAVASFSGTNAVYVFDETSFSLLGSIPANALGNPSYPTNFRKIVRWGQNGIAVSAIPSAFTTNNQIYIFQSPLVKDASSSPTDLSISLTAPATATAGTAITYSATVTNAGPNAALNSVVSADLDSSLLINSIATSQGTCTTGTAFSCDLGSISNGGSVTITVNAKPRYGGTLSVSATVSASSYDPTASNNSSMASTTVTGNLYGLVPAISSISPNLVQAGSVGLTLTVNWNRIQCQLHGQSWQHGIADNVCELNPVDHATITSAQIANYGWAAVTVSNPAPGGGTSAVIPLTIYDLMSVPINSLLYDPYGQLLYATISSTATGITPNSILPINPITGVAGTAVAVGSQPTVMAETSDGNYVYIGLSGSDSLARFNLQTQSVTSTIPITSASVNTPAFSLAAMPGSDTTLAIGISNAGSGNFGIFDVSGNSGSFRTNMSGIYVGANPGFASPTALYAYDDQTTGAEFYRYSIDANGLTLIDGTTLDGMGGFYGRVQLGGNGLVYGTGGGIVNPLTTPPSQIQTLPSIDFYGAGSVGSPETAVVDPSLQKDFLMLNNAAGTWAYGLTRYDLNTYLPEAFLLMPASASGISSNWTMLRFGQDGLALMSSNGIGSSTPTVILLRGPFVAPQELATGTAASLTSSSSSSLVHGSGNITLTLTGSNFLPGVAVTWNGSYRTTTVVDSTHVTVAIPANDLVSSGTASVIATNPGGLASNTLQITIN